MNVLSIINMKNHFLIAYAGNKRNECQNIYDNIKDKLENIDTIVEAFCGTSAVSYYISLQQPNRFKYVLNDNNKHLIELYKTAKSKTKLKTFIKRLNLLVVGIDKEKYKEITSKDTLEGWFIKNSIYSIRAGLFPNKGKIKDNFDYLENCPIVNFLRTEKIKFTNNDSIETFNTYKDNEKTLIFLDPPYLKCCNDFYLDSNTNIYEHLYNNPINNMKAKIILCLESNWIILMLFKDMIKCKYDKHYETSNKDTTHIIINNW